MSHPHTPTRDGGSIDIYGSEDASLGPMVTTVTDTREPDGEEAGTQIAVPEVSDGSLPPPPPSFPLSPPPSLSPSLIFLLIPLSKVDTDDDTSLYQLKWVEWKGGFAPVITQVN